MGGWEVGRLGGRDGREGEGRIGRREGGREREGEKDRREGGRIGGIGDEGLREGG